MKQSSKEHSLKRSEQMKKRWQSPGYRSKIGAAISIGLKKNNYDKYKQKHAALTQTIDFLQNTDINSLKSSCEIGRFKILFNFLDLYLKQQSDLSIYMHQVRLARALDDYKKCLDTITYLENKDLNSIKYEKVKLRFLQKLSQLEYHKSRLNELAKKITEVENEIKNSI